MQRDDLKKIDLPDSPGVYRFIGKNKKILYIGKATSLRDRVRSYFSSDLHDARSSAIVAMVDEATTVLWEETGSVLEAFVLEVERIKTHQPIYNTREKDNKSFNYVVITREVFPQVRVVRGRILFQEWDKKSIKHLYGPFPNGAALREAMKIIRKIFPFRDEKCVPCASRKVKPFDSVCKPCFNRQIGLCPGVCTGEVTREEYAVTIKHLAELFSGNFKGLKRSLASEMKLAAAEEQFEDASKLRRQITALEHIRDVSLIKDERRISSGGSSSSMRIEAYDVAHTGGSETVGVMTVVVDGEVAKDEYRKFKIKTSTNDDNASLAEVLNRRLTHNEWQLPKLIVVDGSTAQLKTAEKILKISGLLIPVVGVVKNDRHKPERLIGDKVMAQKYEKEILLANSEAHTFAIRFHRLRRNKNFLNRE
jgi:excinuclease ABC subunit C